LLAALRKAHPGFQLFLEHDKLSLITYPYEWTYSMLCEAALLTLDLQLDLLELGLSLKDATAYNIQWAGNKPVFIDVSSIEKPKRLDLWFALGQMQRMFLFPLLLCRYRGWDFRAYFLANLDGRNVEQVGRSFGWARWCPSLILDVALPLLFERRAKTQQKPVTPSTTTTPKNNDPLAQIINLKRLRRKIEKLAQTFKVQSDWKNYTSICNYDQGAEQCKKNFVRQWLGQIKPECVLDIGCNTGDYSYLAAECGARVIAADADHDSVELLFRRLKEKPANLTPMVVDLGNPSPAIGYLNQERPAFFQRLNADCVLALALIHHLLVSANFSLAAIRDLFHAMTQSYLVLEFVPVEDSMFQQLLRYRVNLFQDLTLAKCLEIFQSHFEVVRQETVTGSLRTLLLLRKK
jgi:SAM-dependent methyltransferase